MRSLLLIMCIGSVADAFSLYQVGNSLTQDSRPDGVVAIADSAGIGISGGYHTLSNSTLSDIWSQPNTHSGIGGQFGTFQNALPNNQWDAVVLQLYDKGTTYLWTDLQYIREFQTLVETNSLNIDTQIFIYAPWPTINDWGQWGGSVIDSPWQQTNHKESYYNLVMQKVAGWEADRYRLIPVGEVLYEAHSWISSGRLPGITNIGDLYRDPVHLNELGRFIASTTTTAVVLGINPQGLPIPRNIWNSVDVPDDLALAIQNLVWEVVYNQPWTGLAGPDYNLDGTVSTEDYIVWRDNYGQVTNTGDGNLDGVINAADYVIWRDNSRDATNIPEQSSLALWCGLILLVTSLHRSR